MMVDGLSDVVEKTLDSFIRSYRPDDEESYAYWEAELQRVESLLLEATTLPERQDLLASIRVERISLSYDQGNINRVLQQSSETLREAPSNHPSLFVVMVMRARSLHRLGMHEQEIQEILAFARKDSTQGGEYIRLLEHLGKKHPGSVPPDGQLLAKLHEAISAIRAQSYETFPNTE